MIYFYLLEIPNIAYFYATQSNSDLLFINQTINLLLFYRHLASVVVRERILASFYTDPV